MEYQNTVISTNLEVGWLWIAGVVPAFIAPTCTSFPGVLSSPIARLSTYIETTVLLANHRIEIRKIRKSSKVSLPAWPRVLFVRSSFASLPFFLRAAVWPTTCPYSQCRALIRAWIPASTLPFLVSRALIWFSTCFTRYSRSSVSLLNIRRTSPDFPCSYTRWSITAGYRWRSHSTLFLLPLDILRLVAIEP